MEIGNLQYIFIVLQYFSSYASLLSAKFAQFLPLLPWSICQIGLRLISMEAYIKNSYDFYQIATYKELN